MRKSITIRNSRPEDPSYPNFEPSDFNGERNLIVQKGQYLVDMSGDVIVVTSPNKADYGSDFLKMINQGYFRAKYLGNPDDTEDTCGSFLGFANQVRPATKSEIAKAEKYLQPVGAMLHKGEQLVLL